LPLGLALSPCLLLLPAGLLLLSLVLLTL